MKMIQTPDVVYVQQFRKDVYVVRPQHSVLRDVVYMSSGRGLVVAWPVYSNKETKWALTQEEVGQLMGGN